MRRPKFDIRIITRHIIIRKPTIIGAGLMLQKRKRKIPLLKTPHMVLLFLPERNFNPLGLARTTNTSDGTWTALQVDKPHGQVPGEKVRKPRPEAR